MNITVYVLIVAIALKVDVHPLVIALAVLVGLMNLWADMSGIKKPRSATAG